MFQVLQESCNQLLQADYLNEISKENNDLKSWIFHYKTAPTSIDQNHRHFISTTP